MLKDNAILLDLLKAARLIVEFKSDFSKCAFLDDPKTQSAILHQLTIMGEAVKRLSKEYRAAHRQIPWKMIAGMRDKLIHAYDSVDIEAVWETAGSDIPGLITQLELLIPNEKTGR